MPNEISMLNNQIEDVIAETSKLHQGEIETVYRSLFEDNHAAMLLVDPETAAIKDANPAACAYYGWSREELTKLKIDEINTLTKDEVFAQMRLAQTEKRKNFFFKHRRADGSIRDVEIYSGPLTVRGKTLLYSIVHDITDRVQAQQLLVESERRLSTLMENLPGMAYRCINDEFWTMKFISEGCFDLTGYPRDHLLESHRTNYAELIHPDDRQMVWDKVKAAIDKRNRFNMTYRIHCAGGVEKWVMETGQGIFSENNDLLAIEGFITDITERKLAEESLRQSEERHRQIVESSTDAIITRAGEFIVYANPAALKLFRASHAEGLVGKRYLDLVHPDDRAESVERIRKGWNEKWIAPPREHRIVALDGQVVQVESTGVPVQYRGETQLFGIFRDITERKKSEKKLQEWRQLMDYIIRHDPNAIAVYDENLRYIFVSERYLDDYKVKDRNIIGKHHYEVFPEMPERWKQVHQRVLAGAVERSEEDRFERLDGSVDYNRWECRPWYRLDGSIGGMITYTEVITERRRAEEALRKSEAIFNSFMEHCPIYVFFKDENTRPIRLSRNYEQLIGRPIEDLLGKTMDELFPSEMAIKMIEDDLSVIRGGKPIKVVEELEGKIYETTKFPIIQPGKSSLLAGFTVDITDRKRTEEALLQSEEFYRGMFENASIGITRVSLDGIYREVNPAMTRILGYSAAELTGRPVADFTYPDDLGRRAHFLSDLIEGRIVSGEQERRFVHKNGSVVWTLITASVQRDQSGKPLYFISLVQDITDRKMAEEALRKSQDRYRTLVKSAPIGIFTTSSSGQPLAINLAMARILGCISEEEALERYADLANSLYVQPERRNEFMRQLRASDRVENFEYEARAVAGRNIWLNMNARIANRTEDDSFTIEGFTTDITERKLADEKLRETEKKYRELAESLPQVIFEVDSNGNLIYLNHTGHVLFGYTPEDFAKGFSVLEAFIPEDRERVAHDINLNIEGQRLGRQDYTALKKDGTKFPVGVHAGRVMSGQTATCLRGILIDLTETQRADAEKKKLETQLRQAQKMEAIGSLAGGIAHDFNNILSVIIGNAEILKMTDISFSGNNEVDQILAASNRARDLVRQILAFSRQGEQQKILMSLKPVVRETIEFLRASIPTSIQLKHYINPDVGTIMADPTQMQQVLMNLCTNAAHAMEKDGGVLKIELDNIQLSEKDKVIDPEAEPGNYIRITVSDTGHGIPQEMLPRIFDPYFTTKGPDKGTGLGLAVLHGIVRTHGGIVKVYSEVGKGTVFHVLLPKAAGVVKKEEKPEQGLPIGTERILVVDDEIHLLEMYKRMLGLIGYQIDTRSSPFEAIEALRSNPLKYDLLITDMTMPQMNGYNLAKKIMELRPDLPVILCTGFSDQINEEKARSAGILAFLLKPVLFHDLANTLRKALDESNNKRSS
jgi:PAS domain S-box-containing protein